MSRFWIFLLAVSAAVPLDSLRADPLETYLLELDHSSHSTRGEGNSESSSSGTDDLIERVIERRDDGEVVEFDLPLKAGDGRSPVAWQFPVRVLRPESGAMVLLNAEEMAARRDAWLREAKIPVKACGSWIFTWTAFRIECDPEDSLEMLARYDLRTPPIKPGALFHSDLASGAIALSSDGGSERGGKRWSGSGTLDPAVLLAEAIESAIIVGQILGKPVSEAEARAEAEAAGTQGTITITLETDASGDIWRREVRTRAERRVDGATTETTTSVETLVRTPMDQGLRQED